MPVTEVSMATGLETTPEALILVLANRRVSIPWEKCSTKLARATPTERNHAELSPGGYGIHWPLLDEDLSVSGLLRSVG
jgi:hypothetical protein